MLISFLIAIGLLLLLLWLSRDSFFKYMATRHFANLEKEALAEEFRGVETSGGKVENLYQIGQTGVSTEPIKVKAEEFLSSFTSEQLTNITFDIQDEEWRKWCNVDNGIYIRQGISLKEMTEDQKEKAFGLMEAALSAKGLQLSKDIMKTDHTLKEIKNGSKDFDEELYFFTVMGTPSSTEPWGWQIDGHHLVINYFILGDQVVMSPVFMGAEPVIATTGKYRGNVLFQEEQNAGLDFMRSLTAKQQGYALLNSIKGGRNIKAEANSDNVTLDFDGIRLSTLDSMKQEELLRLVDQYVSNMKEGHQEIKMEEVRKHIDDTYFAWVGGTGEESVFYYRIHSPVLLIEFDHQSPVGVPSKDSGPSRNHIHTILRTPNGNDYGKDLLRQHLATAH
jgi:hypothetical protein